MRLHSFRFIAGLLAVSMLTALHAGDAKSFTVRGLKVILKQNPASDIIAAQFYFNGGATVISADKAGIENLALIIAQRATKNYDKETLSVALESMNTQISSDATYDYSSFSMLAVRQNFDRSWDIFIDMLRNPKFNTADVDLERERQLSAIKQQNDDADTYLASLANAAFYNGHPYGIEIDGTEETVGRFTGKQMAAHLKSRLKTRQMLLVVVGNIDQATLKKKVKKFVRGLPKGKAHSASIGRVNHAMPTFQAVERDLPTNYITGLFPAPAYGSADSYAMIMAVSVLRDRVWEEVRTKRGLSYAPSARLSSRFSNFGSIYVTAVSPDTTIKVMASVLKNMQNEEVSDKELRDKVNTSLTRYYLANETNAAQATLLARYELSGAGFGKVATYMNYMRLVTPGDVQRICRDYMNNLQFVLLGDPGEADKSNFMF